MSGKRSNGALVAAAASAVSPTPSPLYAADQLDAVKKDGGGVRFGRGAPFA
jgi:hypothetical protein